MTHEQLEELEYEALQQEKRDKLNGRLQVWSLLVGLIGAFGVVAGIQSGVVAYAVALYPLLAACIARYAGHSESVLSQVKAYLFDLEERLGYVGYEHYNKTSGRRSVGGHMRALRDAIMLTDALSAIVVIWHLCSNGNVSLLEYVLVNVVFLTTLAVMWKTCRWLHDGKSA